MSVTLCLTYGGKGGGGRGEGEGGRGEGGKGGWSTGLEFFAQLG